MIYASFGNTGVPTKVWVEVMWPAWIYDGGFPLLIGYVGAHGRRDARLDSGSR